MKKKISSRWRNLYQKEGMSSFLAALMAIACGLVVGLVILLVSDPANAFGGFLAIMTGAFSSMKDVGQVFYMATPIIFTGLSVGFANKTGLFNIGASGQFVMGAYVAVLVGVRCTFLPGPLLWLACLVAATAAGALWGLVPGLLSAMRNVNIVIACIMMNYVGMYTVNLLIMNTCFDSLKNQTMAVAANAVAPKLGMDQLFRSGASASSVNAGIFVAIAAGIFMYFLIEKTRFGYELKACGYNRHAARYAGINEKRSIILSMAIAGALAGLGGACLYLAGAGKGIEVLDVLATEGFNGIPVALLGMNHPIGIIFSGIFVAYLTQGGFNMQLYGFAPQVIEIIIAVVIYFSAFALILRGFIEKRVLHRSETVKHNAQAVAPQTLPSSATDLVAETQEEGKKGGEKL